MLKYKSKMRKMHFSTKIINGNKRIDKKSFLNKLREKKRIVIF